MKKFTPTKKQARKYADYTVEFKDGHNPVFLQTIDGIVYRFYATAYRYDDEKRFIVYKKPGTTSKEQAQAERWGRTLPLGWWAEFPDQWFDRRRKDNGKHFAAQFMGRPCDDPCQQLELEMMIDAERSVLIS